MAGKSRDKILWDQFWSGKQLLADMEVYKKAAAVTDATILADRKIRTIGKDVEGDVQRGPSGNMSIRAFDPQNVPVQKTVVHLCLHHEKSLTDGVLETLV